MLTKTQKKEIRERFSVDSLTFKSSGEIVAKDFFFYTHGRTAADLGDKLLKVVQKVVPELRWRAETVDRWNTWPKDSWFEVRLFPQTGVSF